MKLRSRKGFIFGALLLGLCHRVSAVDLTSRIFFADGKLSFSVPALWLLDETFPYGPLLTRKGTDGQPTTIVCAISAPMSETKVRADLPMATLKILAREQIRTQQAAQIVDEKERTLAGQNAFEIIWQDALEKPRRHASVYFFVENRIYGLALETFPADFNTMAPGFEALLKSLQFLRQHDTGALPVPARGALWIHQTAGAKIYLPNNWLLAAANDHLLAAATVNAKNQAEFTVTVDAVKSDSPSIADKERQDLRAAIEKKGFKVLSESEEPFHGFHSYRLLYDGSLSGRYVRGTDMIVESPKARWLFSFDADGPFFRTLAPQYADILAAIQFF